MYLTAPESGEDVYKRQNFRCPFCHNAALVLGAGDATGDTPVEEFFAFLDKRHGLCLLYTSRCV